MKPNKTKGSSSASTLVGLEQPAYLNNFLTLAFDAIVAFDARQQISFWNPAAEQLYGWTAQEALGKTPTELFWPVQTDQERATVQQGAEQLERGATIRGEYQARRKDGSAFWVEYSARAIQNDQGGISGYVTVYRDITQRKQAAEHIQRLNSELQAQLDEMQTLLEVLPTGVWIGNQDCSIINGNPAAYRMMGLEPGINASVTNPDPQTPSGLRIFVNGAEVPPEAAPMQQVARSGEALHDLEHELLFSDGTRKTVHANIVPLFDEQGRVRKVIGAYTDLTTHKQMQQELQLISRVPAENPSPVMRLTPDGKILYANPVSAPLLESWNWPADETIPHKLQYHTARAFATGRKREIEVEYDGKTFAFTLVPFSNAGYVNLYGNDITERKQTEQVLAEYARQQDALYRFVEQLQHADSLEEIFNAALDAIQDALGCDRASILLFDASNVMRFRAWRGLSEAYRQATDGHSPWKPDAQNPEPLCMNAVSTADLDDALRTVIHNEGIGALAFIPLVANGKLIGKFMTYYNAPHVFDDDETELSLTIARQLAFSLDHKQTEQSLARERELLERLFETMPVMISMYDPQTDSLRLNAEFERVIGWKTVELTVFSLMESIYPDPEYRMQVVQKMIAAKRDEWVEVQLQNRDGRTLDTIWANISILNNRNIGIGVDITERKRIEEALRIENERFMRFVNSNIVGILIGNASGKVILANDYYLNILGVTRQEFEAGQIDWRRFTPSEWLDADEKAIQELRERGVCEPYEKEYQHADGTRVPVYITDAMLPGPGEEIAAFVIDITERKRAEEALRQSEERFSRFMQHLPGLAWIKDSAGRYVYANAAAEKAFRVTRAELYGKTDQEIFPPEVAMQFRTNDERALADGRGIQVIETLEQEDGVLHHSLVGKFLIPSLDGETILIGGTAFDITERKQAEEALRESEERFREIFETAGVSVWVEDFSAVKAAIDEVRAQGVEDFRAYFAEHPDFVRQAIGLVRILDVNNETVELFKARSKADLLHSLSEVFTPETEVVFAEELVALAEGREMLHAEARQQTLDGQLIWALFTVHFSHQTSGYNHVVVTLTDITERKQTEAQLEAQRRYMQILAEASQAFAEAGPDYQPVLDAIVQSMGQIIGDSCVLRMPSEDGQTHRLAAVYHPDPEALTFFREFNATPLPPDEGTSGRVFMSGQPVFIPVITPEQLRSAALPRFWPYLERFKIHSGLAVPLRVQGRTIGTLSLARDVTPHSYTTDDLQLVLELANRAALAIENARLYTAEQSARQIAQQAAERTARLQQITAALSRAATPSQLAEAVLREGLLAAGAKAGILVELLENGAELRTFAAIGYPPAAVLTEPVPLSNPTPLSDCMRAREAVWIDSHRAFAVRYPALAKSRGSLGNEAVAAIPLITGDQVLGGLAFSFAEQHEFDAEAKEFFLAVAGQCAQGLERALAAEELRVRARQQQAVAKLGELALREHNLQKVFDHATAVVAKTLEIEYCQVLELLPSKDILLLRSGVGWQTGLVGNATVSAGFESQAGYTLIASGPVIVTDLREEKRFHGSTLLFNHSVVSGMSCLIHDTAGNPWGVLGAYATRKVFFTLDDVSFLVSVANILGEAIHREQAEQALRESEGQLQQLNETLEQKVIEKTTEVRQLASALTKAEQRERHRISHILHDDLQQRLYAIQMQMAFMRSGLLLEDAALQKDLDDIKAQIAEALSITRHLSIDLSPPILHDEGLTQAITWLGSQMKEQYGLNVQLQAADSFALPDEEIQVLLFNCVRELLFNIVKHAGVDQALVTLQQSQADLRIEVHDQGQGFTLNLTEPGNGEHRQGDAGSQPSFGIPTIRRQLNLLGGSLEIKSEPGHGTQVVLVIPVYKDDLKAPESNGS